MYYNEIELVKLTLKYAGKRNNFVGSMLNDSDTAKVADPTEYVIYPVLEDFVNNKIVGLLLSHDDEVPVYMSEAKAKAILAANEEAVRYEREESRYGRRVHI